MSPYFNGSPATLKFCSGRSHYIIEFAGRTLQSATALKYAQKNVHRAQFIVHIFTGSLIDEPEILC
jgi:hypothetical protein